MVNTPIPPEAVQIQATFLEGEDTLVLLANVFAVQQQQEDEFVLTIGQVAPLLSGATRDEQREAARNIGKVNVKVITRVVLTKARMNEFVGILQGALSATNRDKEG